MVNKNVTDIKTLQKMISIYVKKDLSQHDGIEHPQYNKRFFPTDAVLRAHVARAIQSAQSSTNDQENLMAKITEWKKENPEDFFHFRPFETSDDGTQPLLFVHQAAWQRRLLLRYGQDIVFLDACYKRTRYSLPLFKLAVKTNIDYQIVAEFILSKENTTDIAEALSVLKSENPLWHPTHFLTDFSDAEIGAIESVFPGCPVLICDFHREQVNTQFYVIKVLIM